jgi:hypothetical protein
MHKNETIFKQRAEYVQKRCANAIHVEREIKRLAKELFLSESTIYKDLKRTFPDQSFKDGNTVCTNKNKY